MTGPAVSWQRNPYRPFHRELCRIAPVLPAPHLPWNTSRPNIVSGQHFATSYKAQHDFLVGKSSAQPTTFNTGAFADSGQYTLGNSVQNYGGLRNPAFYNEDANVRKHFFLGEHV